VRVLARVEVVDVDGPAARGARVRVEVDVVLVDVEHGVRTARCGERDTGHLLASRRVEDDELEGKLVPRYPSPMWSRRR
jgi:hypothetical protein